MDLAQKWCPETNTFIFPWGECTITLEDVFILGGFPVLGDAVLSTFGSINSEDKAMEAKLAKCTAEIRRNCRGNLRTYAWAKYFEGKGDELEHAAFLVLWLSRFVFSKSSKDINTGVFPLVICLAKGTRIALAPAVLASIYRDLSLLKGKIEALNNENIDDGSNLVVWSQLQLVQVWAWERFRTLSPKSFSLVHGEPRIARWHNVHPLKIDRLRLDVGYAEELFLWRPYGLYLKNWEFPKFYSDKEMWVVMNSDVDEDFLSFAMFIRVCELKCFDYVEQYLPHRVGMQFGMDQHIPNLVQNKDLKLAWRSYDKSFDSLKCYVPPRKLEGDITVEYLKWWRGESASHNEVLRACQSQRSRPRKLKILFRGMRTDVCSSRPCNEAMQLDSPSCIDIYKGKLAPVENMVPQSNVSLATEIEPLTAINHDNGMDYGRTCDSIFMEVEERDECDTSMNGRSHHFEGINTQTSSIFADEVDKLIENPLKMVNEVVKVNVLNPLVCPNNESVLIENLASRSSVNLITDTLSLEMTIPENGVKDGRTNEQIPMEASDMDGCNIITDGKTNSFERSHTHISSLISVNDVVAVNKVLQRSETDKSRLIFSEDGNINSLDQGNNLPLDTNIVESTEETRKENSPSCKEQPSENHLKVVNEVEQITVVNLLACPEVEQGRTSDYEDARGEMQKSLHEDAIIVDVEDLSDKDPKEALCKELEEMISVLEVNVSKLMAAKSGLKSK